MKFASSKVYFIGIGGIGMSALAELLFRMGANVSGSDRKENKQTLHLKKIGIKLHIGHKKQNIKDFDVVVYSSSIHPENIEYQTAYKKKIPLISRSEALMQMMYFKRGIGVAGSHGKTTTASFISSIFLSNKKKPTICLGGRMGLINSNSYLGENEWFITEADESDGSFLRMFPEITVITSLDNDHLDHYTNNMKRLLDSFYQFGLNTAFYGKLILFGDDPLIRKTFKTFPRSVVYYGFKKTNDYWIKKIKNKEYEVFFKNKKITKFKCSLHGDYNALNALAAFVVGRSCDFSIETCKKGIQRDLGLWRRFEFKGKYKGIPLYDDYGHHPTEIKAMLKALKNMDPKKRIVLAFQPHRFSRLKSCWKDFLTCFNLADRVFLMDVYPASEKPIKNINSKRLLKELKHSHASYVSDFKKLKTSLKKELKKGDVFLSLGAGDIDQITDMLLKK